ncbi:MAG: response regulator, partial [Desulfobacula sp.]|nr:response regulator [Desulfobacula sp.]
TDWMMPEMDGIELCKKIRKSDKKAYSYIMLLTAKDKITDLVEVFDAGADDYITKPFKPDELKSRINTGKRILELQQEMSKKNLALDKALKDLKETQSQILQSEKMASIGQLAAGVAHEINNPLSGVLTYTKLIQKQLKRPNLDDTVKVIEKHTRSVKKVVQELLKLSRPKPVLTGTCSINDVVTDAIKVFQAQSASKEIQIVSSLEDKLPDINCDAAILEQILTNIWINAFDALQETGGEVKIKTSPAKSKKEVLLLIQDNGPGIPDHILSKIFDPFFTTKELGKGTGLGLSTSYGIIQENGGNISVKETGREGTIFLVELPLYVPSDNAQIIY